MRKGFFVRTAALALAVVFLALLASCATVVQVRDHIPAKVNMGGLKNLAIDKVVALDIVDGGLRPLAIAVPAGDGSNQVKVFTNYNPLLCRQLAERLQNDLVDGLLRCGCFELIGPRETRRLFDEGRMLGGMRQRFIEEGVDAILLSRFSLLSFDEHIISEDRAAPSSDGRTVSDFHLCTSAVVVFDYKVLDVAQNHLLASGSYSKKIEDRSLVATYEKKADGSGLFTYMASNGPCLDLQFKAAVDELAANIPRDLAPRWEYSYEPLISSNKDGNVDKTAYELAGMGDLDGAFRLFDKSWRTSHSLPSGYNAAIILYAEGRLSDAVLYMEEVADRTGSSSAYAKLAELREKRRLGGIAERQLGGERPDATIEEFEIRNFFGE